MRVKVPRINKDCGLKFPKDYMKNRMIKRSLLNKNDEEIVTEDTTKAASIKPQPVV